MQLLLVCLCLGTPVLTTRSSSEDVEAPLDSAFFAMPVQFSMAAPLFNNPQEPSDQQHEDKTESEDWTIVSEPSQSLSHRRGYPRPSRGHRRKHPLAERYRILEEMHARRRRPPPLDRTHNRRLHPRYPPSLEPYSHNYRQNLPIHSSNPHYHHYRPESQHQHNSYEDFPPYASRYQSPSPSDTVASAPTHNPSESLFQQQLSNYQSPEPQTHAPQTQYPSNYDFQSQPQSPQSSGVEFPAYSSNYFTNEPQSSSHNGLIPGKLFPQQTSHYESSGPIQSPRPLPTYQVNSFEYPPLNSHYRGELAPLPSYSESHSPSYQPAGHPGYSGRYQPSRQHSHPGPGPEYHSPVPKELVDLNEEINQPVGESHKSIFHLLLPLLMVGVSIPAIGFMYTHLIRRRSNDGITWPRGTNENLNTYLKMFERGLQCYQHDGKCA